MNAPRGRGAHIRPDNRFARQYSESDGDELDRETAEGAPRLKTVFLPDSARSIVSENDSPDLPFRYSVNPYRGCEHGCAYCYARPTHEYLGMDAGLDFESRILVKHDAPALFRDWLARPNWQPESIAFSGVTDCYQPAERRYRLTRGCLEVALDARQPIGVVTKNALVARDLDLLAPLAEMNLVRVFISLTTLDESLARRLEPRTTSPAGRLRAIAELTAAGVAVGVMLAPVIPGLTDAEIPRLLAAAAGAGARCAKMTLLRLPLSVEPVFREWLNRQSAAVARRVETRIRETRGGTLNDANFGSRMRGDGPLAQQIQSTFKVFTRRYGLADPMPPLEIASFRPPTASSGQLRLF